MPRATGCCGERQLLHVGGRERRRGEEPGSGRTLKPVPGFKGRSGRTFRAKLKLEQNDVGKWRVDFDEEWAKEPPHEAAEGDGAAAEPSPGKR